MPRRFISENMAGNLHDAIAYLNVLIKRDPTIEVVAMECTGLNSVIVYTVYEEYEEHEQRTD